MSIKLEEQDLSKLSPMMQHYLQTKKEYPGCILFYRLGDFYEMFFEDAEIVSRELELTLTGKSCGLPERAPMCGVPFHAVDSYLTRLVEKGYKAAICEQVEDPRTQFHLLHSVQQTGKERHFCRRRHNRRILHDRDRGRPEGL